MELTLNLVWVCVAIAGILAQMVVLSRTAASAEAPVRRLRKIIAMGCTLVILFFVISMTDDLHGQEVLVEERKGSRIAAFAETAVRPALARPIPIDFLLFSPPSAFSANLLAVRRAIEVPQVAPVAAVGCDDLCSRAPPPSFA